MKHGGGGGREEEEESTMYVSVARFVQYSPQIMREESPNRLGHIRND